MKTDDGSEQCPSKLHIESQNHLGWTVPDVPHAILGKPNFGDYAQGLIHSVGSPSADCPQPPNLY